ncbi:DNA integrity scanning protein DisA nucleotide-binding domain protein [Thermostilla marina]
MAPVEPTINRLDASETKAPHDAAPKNSLVLSERFSLLLRQAIHIAEVVEAEAVLLLLSGTAKWARLRDLAGKQRIIVATDTEEQLEGAADADFETIALDMPEYATYDRLSQAIMEAVANEMISNAGCVVAVYSAFEPNKIDTLSIIIPKDHMQNVNAREFRRVITNIPSQVLRHVLDLAVEIGRDGREGHPIGTMFVLGNPRKILPYTSPLGFDPVRGYNRAERNIAERKVREGLKEIAMMDGAFIISPKGIVEAACRYINCPATDITLSKGLGSRHWAAAAITRTVPDAVAVTVSQSDGTVRIFKDGEVLWRIESRSRNTVMWKEFDHRPIPGS